MVINPSENNAIAPCIDINVRAGDWFTPLTMGIHEIGHYSDPDHKNGKLAGVIVSTRNLEPHWVGTLFSIPEYLNW